MTVYPFSFSQLHKPASIKLGVNESYWVNEEESKRVIGPYTNTARM